ncbi:efflux RND transporter periplasmic adaptor subunit [Pinirhizobacter soli]|uniref:efflux RND transporter periplasmic adaptor subunit n=1 Tax=Pinirhizobacter soli TaxID=2786953 RepID=UPI00202A7140|nr:efflux RND transporter periplasmic adaptor subunit [Pinirhizobacter soli]
MTGVAMIAALLLSTARAAEDNPLQLDAEAVKSTNIVVRKASARMLAEELRAPAQVRANAYASTLVTSRVEAQVVARRARLGDEVAAGQPLVELASIEVAQAQGDLIVGEQDWQRVQSLGLQAVSARRYFTAKVQRDQARSKLLAYGLTPGQLSALLKAGSASADGRFALYSPSKGRVTTDDFLVGERVAPGRTLLTVTDESSVWVEASVVPSDASRIDTGASARILVGGRELAGRVVQRAHTADETSRTVPVRIRVDNADDALHAGELVDARIAVGQARAVLAVPTEAVVLIKDSSFIFVPVGNDTFEPRAVKTGASRGGWTPVDDGLAVGAPYVASGAFELKARLLRSQLGEE